MTDKSVPFDTAQQALEIRDLTHSQAMLQREVKSSIDTLTHAVQSVQVEMSRSSEQQQKFLLLQSDHERSSASISEMRSDFKQMCDKLDGWKREQRRERDEDLASSNERTDTLRDDMDKEVRAVRENVIRILAWGGGVGSVAFILLIGFNVWLEGRFTTQAEKTALATALALDNYRANRDLINANSARVDRHNEKIHELELYLARGGQTPARPYVPEKQP